MKLTKNAPLMKDHLCEECLLHFQKLQDSLRTMKIDFQIDGRIVRGLDYYTKTAFEVTCADLGSQDALVGGGRYDLLVEQLGGKRTPAVGFAAGIERLLMVMEKQGLLPNDGLRPDVFLIAADDAGRRWAMHQAMAFRRNGIACDLDLLGRSLKAQMREADRQHARFVIVVGENELKQESVNIKDMKSGEQRSVRLSDLVTDLLGSSSGS